MAIPIRRDFHTKDTAKIKELEKLETLKIIETVEERFQSCNHCHHGIRIDEKFLKEGLKSCPYCGKRAQVTITTNSYPERKIIKINHKAIIDICHTELNKATQNKIVYDNLRHCWFYHFENRKVPVILSGVSSYNQFINNHTDFCWLCIVIDWEANKGKLNNYNTLNFVKFEDILENKVDIANQLSLLLSNFKTNSTFDIENRFDTCIKPLSGTTFESDFVNTLWRSIKEKTTELARYLSFLSECKNTITNSKVVFMGSAGNPDFAVLNLWEYLQEALKPDKIGEAKRYYNHDSPGTLFSWEAFCVAIGHANDGDALFILSTNNIAPSVWAKVVEQRATKGYFRYVIIDKDTLLLLIKVLGIEEMLSKPLVPVKKPAEKYTTAKSSGSLVETTKSAN